MTNYNFDTKQFETMTKQATQQAEEMTQLSQASFDAWVKTTNLWMDGAQNLWKSCTNMANQTRDFQTKAAKEFMTCKTLNEMTETSTKVAQDMTEQAMTNATSLSEQAVKVCMETMEPINDTMSKGFQATKNAAKKAA